MFDSHMPCNFCKKKKQVTGAVRLATLTKKDWIYLFNRLIGGGLAALGKNIYKNRS